MDDEGLGIAHIGEMRDELEAVHKFLGAGAVSRQHKRQDAAEAAGQIFLGGSMGGVMGETGIIDGLDPGMGGQPLGE